MIIYRIEIKRAKRYREKPLYSVLYVYDTIFDSSTSAGVRHKIFSFCRDIKIHTT